MEENKDPEDRIRDLWERIKDSDDPRHGEIKPVSEALANLADSGNVPDGADIYGNEITRRDRRKIKGATPEQLREMAEQRYMEGLVNHDLFPYLEAFYSQTGKRPMGYTTYQGGDTRSKLFFEDKMLWHIKVVYSPCLLPRTHFQKIFGIIHIFGKHF